MPSLKEVRTRIESVRSTQQITSAMKLVAASKLRKSQSAILVLRPYASKLQEILGNLGGSLEDTEVAAYAEERKLSKVLIVVFTSNRGLCGPFNSAVVRATRLHIENNYRDLNIQGNVDLLCIGKKGGDQLKKRNYKVIETLTSVYDDLTFDNVAEIANRLMDQFRNKEYDRIDILYNRFKNAAVQELTKEQFLPVTSGSEIEKTRQADFLFEPGRKEIVEGLIPKTLRTQLFKAILESYASEHGARMTAMHQATDNARELLRDLRLTYNKARQASITKELLEIVSGAEALRRS